MSRKEPIRAPQQERSQKRVELILNGARKVILKKGCAGLKMGDIAKAAKISIGSIYQYFPNKHAIIAGLAQDYLDQFAEHVRAAVEDRPSSLDDLSARTTALLRQYYVLHRNDPVVRDVWMGSATDKELQEIESSDNKRNLEIIFAKSDHLFPLENHNAARLVLFLIISFGGTAIATAVELSEDDGRFAMDQAAKMLSAAWAVSVEPLAHPHLIHDAPDASLQEGASAA